MSVYGFSYHLEDVKFMFSIIEAQELKIQSVNPHYRHLDGDGRWDLAVGMGFYELANYLRGFNMEYL